jgi:hypothetical protein
VFRFFDAAVPPMSVPPGCIGVAGYIGGDAEHVWTLEEWQRFHLLRVLPIWVADVAASPQGQAAQAAQAARGLGWRAHARQRRAIVLDMETSTNGMFVRDFANDLHGEGFDCFPYGSDSSIYADPEMDGYWVALWNDVPNLGLPNEVAHQYEANVAFGGAVIDLNTGDDVCWEAMGRGERRTVSVAAA